MTEPQASFFDFFAYQQCVKAGIVKHIPHEKRVLHVLSSNKNRGCRESLDIFVGAQKSRTQEPPCWAILGYETPSKHLKINYLMVSVHGDIQNGLFTLENPIQVWMI